MRNTANDVLDVLTDSGLIPQSGTFEITDSLIDAYCFSYRSLKVSEDSKYREDKPGHIRFARKVAGVVSDAVKIVAAPVEIALDVTRAVTKPIADVAQEAVKEIKKELR